MPITGFTRVTGKTPQYSWYKGVTYRNTFPYIALHH